MSERLAKLADYNARNYEQRAGEATDPAKRQKLLDKAAKARQDAVMQRRVKSSAPVAPQAPRTGPMQRGIPPAGQSTGPPAGSPMGAPTQRLHAVRPAGRPAAQDYPASSGGEAPAKSNGRGGAMLIGAAVLLVGVFAWATGLSTPDSGSDEVAAGSASPTTVTAAGGGSYSDADRQACDVAGSVLREFGAAAQDVDLMNNRQGAAADTLYAAEQMTGASLTAEDRELRGVLTGAAEHLRDVGGALTDGELGEVNRLADDADQRMSRILTACRPVLTGA